MVCVWVCVCVYSHLEGVFIDGVYDLSEGDLRGECVSVVDDGLSLFPVPAVQLHTAAATAQGPAQHTPQRSQRSGLIYVCLCVCARERELFFMMGECM